MSLIQEALRRREEEQGSPSTQPELPVTPPPREDIPLRKVGKRRGFGALLSVVIVILALLGIGGGLIVFAVKGLRGANLSWGAARPPPAVSPPAARLVAPRPAPVLTPEPLPAAQAAPVPTHQPRVPETVLPVESLPEPPAADEDALILAAAAAAVAPGPVPHAGPADASPDPGGWPDLKVTGVLTRGDPGSSAAIISGDVIGVKEDIEGVVVLQVDDSGVWLEYAGEKRFVKVGRGTRTR